MNRLLVFWKNIIRHLMARVGTKEERIRDFHGRVKCTPENNPGETAHDQNSPQGIFTRRAPKPIPQFRNHRKIRILSSPLWREQGNLSPYTLL